MEPTPQIDPNAVLTAWAPAGRGRIVIVLGQGVVVHKAIVSGKAGAVGLARGIAIGSGVGLGLPAVVSRAVASATDLKGSPFIEKALRNGVEGLLASPRKTLLPWDQIQSAQYRKLALGRARMTIRAEGEEVDLKFLRDTYVAGDPAAVFSYFLADRFTGPSAR